MIWCGGGGFGGGGGISRSPCKVRSENRGDPGVTHYKT
jgi:hypothetical protein